MRRHIIRAFILMDKHLVTIRYHFLHKGLEISAYIGISILTQYQGGAGVVNKYLADTGVDSGLADDFFYLLTDVKGAATAGGKV